MKILLQCIFKDDTEFDSASRMLDSFMPYCHGLSVAITGLKKTQRLERLVKKHKGTYIKTTPKTHPQIYLQDEKGEFFAHFAHARNVVLEDAEQKGGYDWYIWADSDDILLSGEELLGMAQKATELGIDRVFVPYWYSVRVREDGTFGYDDVVIEHLRERLFRPGVFKWTSRLHEVLVAKENGYQVKDTVYEYKPKEGMSLVWVHLTGAERVLDNMNRNIRILEQQIKEENSKDPRTLLYLAKTYYDMKTKEKDELAIFLINDYLYGENPSGWKEERGNAHEYLSNIYARRGDHKKAIDCLHESLKEFPNRVMSMLLLAREYAEIQDTESSSFWLNVAMSMDPPSARTTIGNPMEVKFMAASLKYNEAVRKLDLDGAIHWMKVRNEIGQMKDDGMLATLMSAKAMDDAGKHVFSYAKWLKDTGNVKLIPHLLRSLPFDLGKEQFALYIANNIAEPKIWEKNTIVYFASWGAQHFEKWSSRNLETGIGGSETAVMELSRKWAKMGYDVWVYGDPREDEGDYEGVHYRPWYELNFNDTFNTIIFWRGPHMLDRNIKARKVLMDLHDVANNLDWTKERVAKVDKVMFKSDFHRSMVPNLPDEKVVVLSNGI